MRAFVAIFLFFQIHTAVACDCSRIEDLIETQKESHSYYELIFIGELIKSNEDGSYEFKIIEFFKGKQPDSTVMGKYQTSCSAFPDMTERIWLVYANPDENGIIDINSCGLSRSFEAPFLMNEKATVPPPPEWNNDDLTLSMVKHYQLMTKYKVKALIILRDEIEQLRKWRNE